MGCLQSVFRFAPVAPAARQSSPRPVGVSPAPNILPIIRISGEAGLVTDEETSRFLSSFSAPCNACAAYSQAICSNQDEPLPPIAETTSVTVEVSATGTKLINQYEVLEKLGVGSYGKVKKCRDINTGRTYALKMFNRAALRKPRMNAERTTALDDVLREIRIMKRVCGHPNIVRLVEVLNDVGHDKLYLVVEYCSKGPLMKKNMADYHFTPAEVRQYARDILEGVAFLHAEGIVHRDLKPENVLLSGRGVVKLSDFGVSEEFADNNDELRRTAGTPSFTAPELITAGAPAARGCKVDMWAVGITLYCLAFSRTPFDGVTVMEVYEQIRTLEIQYGDCDEQLRDLLQRLLNRDAARRITAAEALLHRYLSGTIKR